MARSLEENLGHPYRAKVTGSNTDVRRPEMRASMLQANIESFGCLGAENERRVRAQCSEAVDGIEAAVRTAWLPLRYGIEMVQAVEDVCGREVSLQLAREAIARSMQGTLLGPILNGLMRLGLGPEHAFKRAPAGWGLVYKNCGNIVYTTAPNHVTLRLQGAPKAMRELPYLHSIGGSFQGMVMALGVDDATVSVRDDASGVIYDIRWG
mgnify:CR=1 FL=1